VAGPVIVCEDLHIRLGTGAVAVHVLRGIDLEIPPGESLSLVGPSGSGKSTLLMALAGLERPTSGRIRINGTDITGLGEDALARLRGASIGIVFQSFHLIPSMTALENVAVPLELAGAADAFERAKSELHAVGLGDRLEHYPAELSGGEQQRVAIARALSPNPAILLADEPSGNLDSGNGAMIADLLFKANADRGMTLVLVTHDADLAERSGRVVRLNSGQVVEEEVVLTEEDEAALAQGAEDIRVGRIASDESVKAILDRYRETPAS
jgi:putative ABC transport system ATP-binding protein